jgi:hypothetical protein
MDLVNALQSEKKLVDVRGFEPLTPCLQSRFKFNLSRCFGCAYSFKTFLGCSKVAPKPVKLGVPGFRDVHTRILKSAALYCASRRTTLLQGT